MKLTKQLRSAILDVYEAFWGSLFNVDIEIYSMVLDNNYRLIGTTEKEVFFNKKEAIRFLESTAHQLAGNIERRKPNIRIETVDSLILITEQFDAYVLIDNAWTFYGRTRVSTWMQQKPGGWKIVQQHFSFPDIRAEEGQTIGLEKLTRENLELRDAIKRRTIELEQKNRELEIEATLEKVRSRSLAVQKTREFKDVIKVVFEGLTQLGVRMTSASINIFFEDSKDTEVYICGPGEDGLVVTKFRSFHFDHPIANDRLLAHKKNLDFFSKTYTREEKNSFYKNAFEVSDLKHLPADIRQMVMDSELYTLSLALSKNSMIVINDFEGHTLPEDQVDIVKRFARVFEQAYVRFLDLQKAETQAREAKIEAALERTRTQSMIMQHSKELDDTLRVFHEQVLLLGIQSAFSFLWLPDEVEERHIFWAAWGENRNGQAIFRSKAVNYALDRNEPATAQCIADWRSNESVYSYHVQPPEVENYFAVWQELLNGVEHLKPRHFSNGLYYVEAFMKYGCFGVMVENDLSDDEKNILSRFAVEFERTYTRFLDLQKAEAQAREAQIEAALERVRSRTMGMQKSEDLKDIIQVVYDQFVQLNILVEHAGFLMDYKENDDMHIWLADEHKVPAQVTIPYFSSPHWNSFIEAKEKGSDFFANQLDFEEKNRFYRELFEHFPGIPDESREYYLNCPGLAISTVLLDNVGLYIENFSGIPYSDAENSTLMRFGKVFQQTYSRFHDLQIAEAQARESGIQLALERVRSRTMAMHQSHELADVASELFGQMNLLVSNLWSCGFVLCEKDRAEDEWWLSTEKGFVRSFYIPNVGNYAHATLYEGWKNHEEFRTVQLEGDALQQHYDWLIGVEVARRIFEEMDANGIERPTWQKLHAAYFSKGYLVIITREPSDGEEIFKRFAKVFDLVYTRFLDLQKAEAQAIRAEKDLVEIKAARKTAEDTLKELQLTQKQLIQSEKMASLGELTAGIAHEIQNPLNFVNNFSEVSKELLEEMKAAMETGDQEEAGAIAKDIIQNLEKINHHGKRADAIVKGMLQHSRSSSTQKEPTDINALADEYLRLAYHGLRAKNKSFNAAFETAFDPSIGKINVVPQDLGRVILNLINNAFYAVSEKEMKAGESFKPSVWLRTKKLGSLIEITIADNGPGIPDDIREKIFQPFFTTKPTGQGTGLGLSLTYDIIKAHDGEIQVSNSTDIEAGAVFTILLPA